MATFSGFPRSFFQFFTELAAHNDKAWFDANKDRYREVVVGPATEFIAAMAPRLAKISKHLVADPRPNGGSMFRIYRDIRFGKDKRPYKDHAGIQFRHRDGKTAHAPGFYVHLSPDEVFFGGGVWMPEPDALAKIRSAIAKDGKSWSKATSGAAFTRLCGAVQGEKLARPPKGFAADHPLVETLKHKSFFAMHDASAKAVQSKDAIDRIEEVFAATKPMMAFLCKAVGAPF